MQHRSIVASKPPKLPIEKSAKICKRKIHGRDIRLIAFFPVVTPEMDIQNERNGKSANRKLKVAFLIKQLALQQYFKIL